jgi:hypothetical protein
VQIEAVFISKAALGLVGYAGTCKYNIPRITSAFHFVMRPNAAFEINTASICTVAYLVIRSNANLQALAHLMLWSV